MITILTIISMLVIAAYTAAVCVKTKGVPYSISATYYYLEHKLWFMATMWLTAGLLMPAILEVSKPNTEWIAFCPVLACSLLVLLPISKIIMRARYILLEQSSVLPDRNFGWH